MGRGRGERERRRESKREKMRLKDDVEWRRKKNDIYIETEKEEYSTKESEKIEDDKRYLQ